MAGEHEILGGFRAAGGHVDVSAQTPGRLLRHQLPPVVPLGDGLVAGGEIEDQFRAAEAQHGAGGQGRPEILTQLNAQPGAVGELEQATGRNQNRINALLGIVHPKFGGGDHAVAQPKHTEILRRGEPALFVEFAIIGHIGFGDDALN